MCACVYVCVRESVCVVCVYVYVQVKVCNIIHVCVPTSSEIESVFQETLMLNKGDPRHFRGDLCRPV